MLTVINLEFSSQDGELVEKLNRGGGIAMQAASLHSQDAPSTSLPKEATSFSERDNSSYYNHQT